MSIPTAQGPFEPLPLPQFEKRQLIIAFAILAVVGISALVVWPAYAGHLFSESFLPHRFCYLGNSKLVWTHVLSDFFIGLAYFSISATIIYLVYKGRRNIAFHWMFLLLGLFILACGATHFVEVLTVWIPLYVLSGSVKIFTALASVATAILLPFTVPQMLTLVKTAREADLTNERLSMAMEAGKSVGWDWNVKTGRDFWFGDLQTMFGIAANTYSGNVEEFRRFLHPEDRGKVWKAVHDAMQERMPYVAEFRVVREDGRMRWVVARGKFYYAANGEAERMLGMSVDVTDRKSAEEKLQQRELELTEAQRLARVGSWKWEPESDTVAWSNELFHIAGRDPSLPAPGYREHPKIYTPESWERLHLAVQGALRTGAPYELDLEMVHTDGATRWVIARGETRRDAAGNILGLRGTVQDITDRKRVEESLALFRKLIDASDDIFVVVDLKTLRLLDVNDKGCRDLGYSREELLSMTVMDIDPIANEPPMQEVWKKFEQTGSVNIETVHRRKDGTTFPVEINIKSVPLDRSYAVSVVRDITERKKIQEALQESEERLRLAVHAGKMFAYSWDAATDVIVRSGESAAILGIDEESAVTGQSIATKVHPDDREKFNAAISGLSRDQPDLQVSYRMLRPDGKQIWLERNSRGYFDEQGKLQRIVGMVADVTERKQAEEVLSSMSRRLIEAQETERNRIARDLHDDIGQRMALLAVRLEQLKQIPANSKDKIHNSIAGLQQLIIEITTDIQAISHELHPSRLEHLGLAVAVRGFCRELSEQQKVEIRFRSEHVPNDVPPDISLCLFRVLQEALHNAVKHSNIRVFDVDLRGTQDTIYLTVQDTGVGFDTAVALQGTGLGLTSMQERLKLVHGELSVTSQPSKGTTIRAQVPLPVLRYVMPEAG